MKKTIFGLSLVVVLIALSIPALRNTKSEMPGQASDDHTVAPKDSPGTNAYGNVVIPAEESSASDRPIESLSSGKALAIADVPKGELRDGLEKLPEETRLQVLERFSKNPHLLSDADSLRVDPGGALYYVCTFPVPPDEEVESVALADAALEESIETAGALVPISSPPALHSRPGVVNVLFLDFNGHVIEGTAWNTSRDVAQWDCLPYDKDGDTTTFSASELSAITQIWERVSEDYAPFDVDVTTEQPLVWSSKTGHALITPGVDANGTNCPHSNAGGIAYLDKFGKFNYSYNYSGDSYSPVWCRDYSAASTAEVISHELGHNLNLSHDGTDVGDEEYYDGHVNGSIEWAPIMGVGYGKDVTQWSKGEYHDSNQSQDDLFNIASRLSYRSDDHGNSDGLASALSVDLHGTVSQSGVVETTGDPDVFSFSTGTGTITIFAEPYRAASSTWGGNLDILLELYDSGGALLETNNPALEVSASITRDVPAGTYFLHVKPTGVGSPLSDPPTGYTSYGSLGQYGISGMVSADADGDGIPNEWETLYFGGFTNAVATADSDGDGTDNLTEYVAGTLPHDIESVFQISSYSVAPTGTPVILNWATMPGRLYGVGYSSDLKYTDFTAINGATHLPHTQNSYTDTVYRTGATHFYRIDVQLEE